eukprot:951538_1
MFTARNHQRNAYHSQPLCLAAINFRSLHIGTLRPQDIIKQSSKQFKPYQRSENNSKLGSGGSSLQYTKDPSETPPNLPKHHISHPTPLYAVRMESDNLEEPVESKENESNFGDLPNAKPVHYAVRSDDNLLDTVDLKDTIGFVFVSTPSPRQVPYTFDLNEPDNAEIREEFKDIIDHTTHSSSNNACCCCVL